MGGADGHNDSTAVRELVVTWRRDTAGQARTRTPATQCAHINARQHIVRGRNNNRAVAVAQHGAQTDTQREVANRQREAQIPHSEMSRMRRHCSPVVTRARADENNDTAMRPLQRDHTNWPTGAPPCRAPGRAAVDAVQKMSWAQPRHGCGRASRTHEALRSSCSTRGWLRQSALASPLHSTTHTQTHTATRKPSLTCVLSVANRHDGTMTVMCGNRLDAAIACHAIGAL